ncbi:hypothetical protein DUI87_16366 [Hirundo rustica rustica]|uniref:Uncharacterized protein n=1 Tax=Hirundo rustica rustica TaxID=333673 RepID=A0A3M0K122_HIRRU|nr:hypothetical protein DUI87_16366 [Hirundo rustica rustica]
MITFLSKKEGEGESSGFGALHQENYGDSDDGRVPKCTFSKFPGTTKLRVATDTPNKKVAMQRDLDRVKEQTNRNVIKFHTGKCIALPLENNFVHQYNRDKLYGKQLCKEDPDLQGTESPPGHQDAHDAFSIVL